MAGFYNPFSAKPDYGSGIQELLGQLAQMIMIKKMGKEGGQPGSQSPMMGQRPQPGLQGPTMGPGGPGGAPMQQGPPQGQPPQQGPPQMGSQGGPPQQPMMPPRPQPGLQGPSAPQGNSILNPQDIQMLSSQMPPELMQIILKLLGEGKFTQPKMG